MKKEKTRDKKEVRRSIFKGLDEAVKTAAGIKRARRAREVIIPDLPIYSGGDIKKIRKRNDMTQRGLAIILGVSVKTVEAWEGNRNIPDGPAQRLFFALDKKPAFLKMFGIKMRCGVPKGSDVRAVTK